MYYNLSFTAINKHFLFLSFYGYDDFDASVFISRRKQILNILKSELH